MPRTNRLFVGALLIAALSACSDDPLAPREEAVPAAVSASVNSATVTPRIDGGGFHTCMLESSGSVKCWGANWQGQSPASKSAASGHYFTYFTAGKDHNCALREDGVLECWGFNPYGNAPATRSAPSGMTYTRVEAAANFTCALRSDGAIECFGYSHAGQAPALRTAPSGMRYTALATGHNHGCALRTDAGIECWGDNYFGAAPAAVQYADNGATFVDVYAGNSHSCGIRNDTGIECWGNNNFQNAPTLQMPPTGKTWISWAADTHSCFVRNDGVINCIGYPMFGEAPAERIAANGAKYVTVGVGSGHTCALRDDGEVDCWGRNNEGQAPPSLSNRAPEANAGADQTVQCTGATTSVTLNGTGSTDPDGNTLSYSWKRGTTALATGATPNVGLGLGSHLITLTVDDGRGLSDTDDVSVNIVDTTAPVVTLNGPATITLELGVDSYAEQGATANDGCAGARSVTISGSVNSAVPGTYVLTYSAADPSANSASATRTVRVRDTRAPVVTVNKAPLSLWPPNHQYVEVQLSSLALTASDADASVSAANVVITQATSDEAVDAEGDGDTADDIVIAADGRSVKVRAERAGGGNGRVYVIHLGVRDSSGNVGTATYRISVAPNAKGTAVADAPRYVVTGRTL